MSRQRECVNLSYAIVDQMRLDVANVWKHARTDVNAELQHLTNVSILAVQKE
jgi:hypothetical protein